MDKSHAIDALSALAQETRLAAFRFLIRHRPDGVSAGEIARHCEVPHNTLSTHLAILARSGLVESERQGREMIYRADIAGFRALMAFLAHDCCGGRPEVCGPVFGKQAMRTPAKRTVSKRNVQ
jgi:DNA-binding transcriptional ArsR family regulator